MVNNHCEHKRLSASTASVTGTSSLECKDCGNIIRNTLQILTKENKMTERDFIYWLGGYLELSNNSEGITPAQVQIIKDHIKLVLDKQTPTYPLLTGIKTPTTC